MAYPFPLHAAFDHYGCCVPASIGIRIAIPSSAKDQIRFLHDLFQVAIAGLDIIIQQGVIAIHRPERCAPAALLKNNKKRQSNFMQDEGL